MENLYFDEISVFKLITLEKYKNLHYFLKIMIIYY